jgi:arsenite methyltransferase
MAEAAAAPSKPDYGLDAPHVVKRMFSRGAWVLATGLAVYFINHTEYPGPSWSVLSTLGSIGVTFLGVGAFMVWSSRVAKPGLRDKLIDSLGLTGDEKVLDVGCGRGLMLIGAAKRLKTGKATGIDIWSKEDLSGNSADAAKLNAKLEGVPDRVRIENGDARKLVYPDNNYDVVISSLAIHNISDGEQRDQAVRQMWRVLKPGGRLLIFDIFHTAHYAKVLRECGAKDVTVSGLGFLWCVPSRSLLAKK